MQFWQTKSFAIITFARVPGDCIDRVISQNGDRVIFERLATPRPAPKVTLKSNWHTQQQQQQQPQQPTLEKDVNIIWKQHATWESKVGVRDDTKNATEMEIASRNLVRAISEVGRWYSSQYTGSHHRYILEQRSGYSRNRMSENWFEQNLCS